MGGVGARRCYEITDAVAGSEIADVGTDRFNNAGGLVAEAGWQLGGIEAAAYIGVYEIEADRLMADQHLAGARLAERDRLGFENFRPASFTKADGGRGGPGPRERPFPS